MATLYGVNATKRDVTVPSDKIPAGEVNGRRRVAYDTYVAAGVLALNDVINFMKIPAGARVIDAVVKADDLGTTGLGKLGWLVGAAAVEAAHDDGLIASLDFKTAAALTRATTGLGIGKEFLEEVQVQLTITEATTVAGTIQVWVEYLID